MSGNATEDALLTRIDYPGHLDAGRIGGLSGAVAGLLSWLLLGGWLGLGVGLLAGFGLGALVYRRLERRRAEARAAEAAARRAGHERDVEAGIAAMKLQSKAKPAEGV